MGKALSLEEQHKRQAKERLANLQAIKKRREQEEIDKKRRERIKSLELERHEVSAKKALKAAKGKPFIKKLLTPSKRKRKSSW